MKINRLEISDRMLPELYKLGPFHNQCPPGGSVPIFFDVRVTVGSQSGAVVMAKAALERLIAGAMQLAPVVHQKVQPADAYSLQANFSSQPLNAGERTPKVKSGAISSIMRFP